MSDVAKPSGLVKRKGSSAWYYRRRYAREVAERLGKREFWQSLNTSSYGEALKRLPDAEAAYLASLAAPSRSAHTGIIRHAPSPIRNLDQTLPELVPEMVAALAAQHLKVGREALHLEAISSRRSDDWKRAVEETEWRLHTLADPDDPNTCRWTEAEETQLLTSNGLRAEATSLASRQLREELRRSMMELEKLRRSRLNGDWHPVFPSSPVAGTIFPANQHLGHKATPLREIIKLYREEFLSTGELTAKTVAKAEAALGIINRYFKAATPVASIDRGACYAFRDMLAKLPPNATKKHGNSSDLTTIAEKNAALGRHGLSKQTQEPYLRTLSRLLDLAKDRRLVSDNVALGIKPKGRSIPKEDQRNAYSQAQLTKIFQAPIYTGCKDDGRNFSKPGTNRPRRSRFWCPLIALFTGLRLEEILQLTSDHVFEDENGEPYLRLTRDMKVKTNSGYRALPIHPQLVKIGFMKLVAEAASREDHLLITDVPRGSDDYRSTIFSKRYATFSRSLKIEEPGREVTFHSFRHTFRDALRLPYANPDLVKELGGWSRGSETSTAYGDGARPEVLRALIEQIDFRVDLSHLYRTDENTSRW